MSTSPTRIHMPKSRKNYNKNKRNFNQRYETTQERQQQTNQTIEPNPQNTPERSAALTAQQVKLILSDCGNLRSQSNQAHTYKVLTLNRLLRRIEQCMREVENIFRREPLTDQQVQDLLQCRESLEMLACQMTSVKAQMIGETRNS